MLSTRPYLSTLRPSSTTVSYTVSTSLPPRSLASHATQWLFIALRLIIGFICVFALAVKYLEPISHPFQFVTPILIDVPWTYIAPAVSGVLILVFRRFYTGKMHLSSFNSPLEYTAGEKCAHL